MVNSVQLSQAITKNYSTAPEVPMHIYELGGNPRTQIWGFGA